MYMLMDAADPAIEELLGFSPIRPLRTVHSLLEEKGGLALLTDPLLPTATAEIVATGRSRPDVQRAIKAKEAARAALARRYASATLSADDVLRAIYSLADNAAFLAHARDPVDRALALLDARFPDAAPAGPNDPRSLAIAAGVGGARLTHSHARQRAYVRQSLALWRAIAHDSFRLWCLADADMLDPTHPHRLSNTGQGLQRVQPAPRVGAAMRALLAAVQARLGSWVGSAVVHLGDHNVPNALFFLVKYNAVPALLNPVVLTVEALPRLAGADPQFAAYVERAFGSVDGAAQAVLQDFFRHGFDGSGADNFFDAGSCVDGRLTSAWNWSQQLHKKPFEKLFQVSGFSGFDGKEWAE